MTVTFSKVYITRSVLRTDDWDLTKHVFEAAVLKDLVEMHKGKLEDCQMDIARIVDRDKQFEHLSLSELETYPRINGEVVSNQYEVR